MQEILRLLNLLIANKEIVLIVLVGLAALYGVIQCWVWLVYGPKDITGNGLTIGQAKAFDHRSLQLRIERLGASLAGLNVVSQKITENLATLQKHTSTKTSRTLTAELKGKPKKAVEESANATEEDKTTTSEAASTTETGESEARPAVALAASDVLSEQLNLASQILNLETLYERSLTDRLLDTKTRLQAVLGFQVSITPPRGCENAVAVVEVAVRMLNAHPVSLVALIPQEKTYNAQAVSTSAKSISGSAVASVLTLGVSSKGETRQLFIHRDSDTIAFERDPRSQPTIFENDSRPTVFGWEFRPVLGRKTVSPGTRQLLAVIAVPTEELETEDAVKLEVCARSYWRHFNRRTQATGSKWSWLPWRIDQSRRIDSPVQQITIPNTARIQTALKPVLKQIKWVNSGPDRATVLVKGWNFFSGTKVIIGGVEHREENGSLTLKSNQALEFETTVASLATGDCVLSGRFGSSLPFNVEKNKDIHSLQIIRAVIEPSSLTQEVYIHIDIVALNEDGKKVSLTVADMQKLPEPILFVGAEAIKLPYDYFEIEVPDLNSGDTDDEDDAEEDDKRVTEETAVEAAVTPGLESESKPLDAGKQDPPEKEKTRKYLQVGAWISKTLASSPSVAFKVPFCGFEYQTSYPLSYSEPTVTRLGSDDENCIFRILSPGGFYKPFSVELDKTYDETSPELRKTSPFDYRFTVPIRTVKKYRSVVLRTGKREPYVLPISAVDKPEPKTTLVTSGKPPQVTQNSVGPVTWSGTALDAVRLATLITEDKAKGRVLTAADFSVYEEGTKIDVYFREGSTAIIGKAAVDFVVAGGEKLTTTVFIIKDAAA